MKRIILLFSITLLTVSFTFAQESVGLFDNTAHIGEPLEAFPEYNADDGKYTIDAVGAALGRQPVDECFFAYNEMSGNFAIEADPFPVFEVGMGGIIIRQSVEPDSAFGGLLRGTASAAGGNTGADFGSVWPRIRSMKGGGTITDGDPEPGGYQDFNFGRLRVERIGNSIHLYTYTIDDETNLLQSEFVMLEDPVLTGLATTAQDPEGLGLYEFTQVSIEEIPNSVVRSIPTDDLEPGSTITGISITADFTEGATPTITEELPFGTTASNAQVTNGTMEINEDGDIEWDLGPDFTGEAILTYDLTLGEATRVMWPGTYDYDGIPESLIGGDIMRPTTLPSFPESIEPVQADPNLPTVFQAENGIPNTENDQMLGIDPNLSSGAYLINMSGGASSYVTYTINIPEDGTWYFFGSTRGEDGNSDSWYPEVDAEPSGDGADAWDFGGGFFNANWVERRDPDEDPRPFELSAGEHIFYLGNREDSASIDWLAVTNNPDISLDAFNENTELLLSRGIDDSILKPDGHTITVTLTGRENASLDLEITENTPAGWTLSDINPSNGEATLNGDQIVWNTAAASGIQTLEYQATPPADAIGGIFSGSTTHNNEEITTGGDTLISNVFEFAHINDDNPTPVPLVDGDALIEAEDAYVYSNPEDAQVPFDILFHPDASQQKYAQTAVQEFNEINGNELNFVFEVQQTGTYKIVARTRTPSGEDDSFYIGMDDDIGTDNGDYRFQGAAHQGIQNMEFQTVWVRTDGIEDLSWELEPGVHRFRVHIREDGTAMDWIYITDDIELDVDTFDFPVTGVWDFMLY
ncbi:hypothetical protein GF373_10590 [bacterium]|nr:hypothetical protein [bacterium]